MKIKMFISLSDKPIKNIAQVLLCFVFIVLSFGFTSAQISSQDPGHKEDAEIAGVKFSVPNRFNLEKSSNSRVAFMWRKEYGLGLFVAVPEKQVDDTYLTNLSKTLISQLFPKEKGFRWKLRQNASDKKASKFQTLSGNTKGFNGKSFFLTDYITVKVKDREVLVGYITQLTEVPDNAEYLFELESPGGLSMPGWYAQAHILASITGEKYEEINPGAFIIGTPVKKN